MDVGSEYRTGERQEFVGLEKDGVPTPWSTRGVDLMS